MNQTRLRLIVAAVLVIAAILAVPLRDIVYEMVVVPVSFIGWRLSLVYLSLPQVVWWWLAVAVIVFMLAFSLIPHIRISRREKPRSRPVYGPLEELAMRLRQAGKGVYFKWLIANRLGKLAHRMLLHRESGRPRTLFTPLLGEGWEPGPELQKYLETGLHGSFSSYTSSKGVGAAHPKTPLDFDVGQAVEFLEDQLKNGRDSTSGPQSVS